MASRLWQVPLRLATGAFILQSGLGKRGADTETATTLHGFASGTYPMLQKLEPARFARLLSAGEIALGSALLAPFVPARFAGLALMGFSSGLLGLYWKTPGMRQEGSPLPTQEGITLAKDAWILAIGLALLLSPRDDRATERVPLRAPG
jgi:uncharacterized membrane protein YphA (DoxX/SURF4 family)